MGIEFYGLDSTTPHPKFPEHPALIHLEPEDPRGVGLNQANAAVILRLLGVDVSSGDLIGSMPIANMRRAIMAARARLPRVGPSLVRPDVVEYGKPRAQEDGTVELRPLRFASRGLDTSDMASRLERLARLVEVLAELGATEIAWA